MHVLLEIFMVSENTNEIYDHEAENILVKKFLGKML